MNTYSRAGLAVIVSLFATASVSHACSCTSAGPFLEAFKSAHATMKVEVIEYLSHFDYSDFNEDTYEVTLRQMPTSMKVRVVEVLRGTEDRTEVLVWGDNGVLCRPYLDAFEIGTIWIMALHRGNPQWGNGGELESDYALSLCGEYTLRVEAEAVSGAIACDSYLPEYGCGIPGESASIERMAWGEFMNAFRKAESELEGN